MNNTSQTPIKRLRIPHIHNLRDLGGFIGRDDRMIRWNMLYRGAALDKADEKDWDRLRTAGIKTVLDLRSTAELMQFPDYVPEDISYIHAPMQTEQIDISNIAESATQAFAKSLKEGYLVMVKENADLLITALRHLINGLKEGAVLFHCSAGKDRTGVLAAVVLYLCGVEEEDIIADYQVSYTYNRNGVNKQVQGLPDYEKILPMIRSDAENMEHLLAYFQEIQLEQYLEEKGFSRVEQGCLTEMLLNEA